MKLANDVEEQKKQEEIINAWKEANGYKDKDGNGKDDSSHSIYSMMKCVLA